MHDLNWWWWNWVKQRFPHLFQKRKVLELGSRRVMKRRRYLRMLFEDCDFIGIDMCDGSCVDRVIAAKDIDYKDQEFEVVISASMLEHDPDWRDSVRAAARVCSGVMLWTWGAARNPEHCVHIMPFCPCPAGQVLSLVKELGFDVREFRYEGNLAYASPNRVLSPNGLGEVCMIACRPDSKIAELVDDINFVIDELMPEDRCG